MGRSAGQAEAGRYAMDAEEEMLMAETAEAMQALRARLSLAQERAAAADLRREQIVADHTQSMRTQIDDVRRLEDTIDQLKKRARDYNRALNEAATLVDEMNNRISAFERQIAAMHILVAAACPAQPTGVALTVLTEEGLARDLDLIRKRDGQTGVMRLKLQLDEMLAA